MPNKSHKLGYKVWYCSCSCCGYLSTFQFYDGRSVDVVTGEKVSEKDLGKRVASELVAPFVGMNHVVYCDNLYTSGPLVDRLAKDKVYLVDHQEGSSRFPE